MINYLTYLIEIKEKWERLAKEKQAYIETLPPTATSTLKYANKDLQDFKALIIKAEIDINNEIEYQNSGKIDDRTGFFNGKYK